MVRGGIMITTSKQDRGSVKTASDLEQKYDLASISTMKVAIENSEVGLNKTNTTLEEFMSATIKSLEDLQDQVDGNITTWFFNGIPTLENAPANEWTTEEDKINHLGDLYYDEDTGYAYRFSMINNAYEWAKITDTDVVKALALANSAQDTADSKRRVFVSTPVPPYDSGDLWFKDSEIYICQISKDKDQVYAEKDFIIATKYTDDTYAKQVGNELKVLSGTVTTIKEGVDQFEVDITTRVDGLDEDLTVAQTDLEMVQGQISAKVWQADIDIEKSTSASSGAQILLTDSADGKVIDFSAYGRSEQDGTPTLDNPIDIVSVGDKGFFDGELLQGAYAGSTGNWTSTSTYVCNKNMMPCKAGDKIKLEYEEQASQLMILFYDSNKNFIKYVGLLSVGELEVDAIENACYFNINVNNANGITPTNAKHICVTINGMYALIQKRVNKNLFNANDIKPIYGETLTIEDNIIIIGAKARVYGIMLNNADVGLKVGETYTLSVGSVSDYNNTQYGFRYGYADGTYSAWSNSLISTITVEKEIASVLFYVGSTYNGNKEIRIENLQIEQGAVATDYVPHEEQTTYIPLTEPLRSVGEVKDEIVKQDGVWGVLRRIANVVIDENSNINSSIWQGYNRFSVVIPSKYASVSPFDEGYCNHMRYSKDVLGASTDDNTISVYTTGTIVVAYFRMDKFTTVDELKTWLADNPITVEYELSTETFTPFADQTPFRNITTYNPVTYITNSDDAEMEVEYYRNSFNGQTLANTSAELEMKIGRDENNQIISMINASADEINLKSNRFSLESDNTTITKDGKIVTKELNANGGEIGGWEISENGISKETEAYVQPISKHSERIKQYMLKEIELSDTELQYYDVNGDGVVDMKDAYRIRRYNRGDIEYKDAENAMKSSLIITFNPKDGTKTLKFESINPIGELIEAYIGAAQCKFPSIIGDYLNVSDIYGKEITGTTITGENVVTGAGANLDDKLNSTVINIDSSNTKTVRITVPSGFYSEGIYANRTYYILPSPLMYFDTVIAAYGGNTIPYAIGGVVNDGNRFSLITSVMTSNTSSSYATLPTVNSVSINEDILTISLKLPTTSSIMSLNSNINIV